eukprot:SAG22_NODE_3320_length_1780_cov_2.687686_1_plen_423_part_00
MRGGSGGGSRHGKKSAGGAYTRVSMHDREDNPAAWDADDSAEFWRGQAPPGYGAQSCTWRCVLGFAVALLVLMAVLAGALHDGTANAAARRTADKAAVVPVAEPVVLPAPGSRPRLPNHDPTEDDGMQQGASIELLPVPATLPPPPAAGAAAALPGSSRQHEPPLSPNTDGVTVVAKVEAISTQELLVSSVEGQPAQTHDTITYRLLLTLGGGARNCYTIFGQDAEHMRFPPAYQSPAPFGSNIGGVKPAFLELKPELAFDSWLTGAWMGAQSLTLLPSRLICRPAVGHVTPSRSFSRYLSPLDHPAPARALSLDTVLDRCFRSCRREWEQRQQDQLDRSRFRSLGHGCRADRYEWRALLDGPGAVPICEPCRWRRGGGAADAAGGGAGGRGGECTGQVDQRPGLGEQAVAVPHDAFVIRGC